MPGVSELFLLSIVHLDDEKPEPLYKQLSGGLREAILSGQLPPDSRLPSIRDMSQMLGISRNTITNALDELIAEGYLKTKPGAGTFVIDRLPDELLTVKTNHHSKSKPITTPRKYSQRSKLISRTPQNWVMGDLKRPAFQYGLPALDHFPHDIWAQLSARHYRYRVDQRFDFSLMTGGYQPLREAIVDYLQSARGVKCNADQIIIVSGAHQGIYLSASMLLDPGDKVLVEEPGFTSAHRTFQSVGAEIIPVPIDRQGIDINLGQQLATEARVVFVKPSRQHPTGRTMTLERRLVLIKWAQHVNGWIIEDDYGCAFNYTKRPLPALQGLDSERRVIYVGTFSKVLFPSLRLGYIVAPDDLIDKFMSLRSIVDSYIPTVSQVILTEFIEQGHFTRHLRRMRQLYAERREIFMTEAENLLGSLLEFESSHAGTSIVGWLSNSTSDLTIAEAAAQKGVTVMPISPCYFAEPKRQGLLFGYAACDEATIKAGLLQVADSFPG